MKFLATHRNAVHKAIAESKYELEAFNFVKRRGRIHIIHKEKDQFFSYIRKIEMQIDENRQWKKITQYELQQSDVKPKLVDSWDDVLLGFKQWLTEL